MLISEYIKSPYYGHISQQEVAEDGDKLLTNIHIIQNDMISIYHRFTIAY